MIKYWKEYTVHSYDIVGKRKKVDNNIYSFDIETTSYFVFRGEVYPSIDYQNLTKKEQEECQFGGCMYVWQFGINEQVYYGRTWDELDLFLSKIDDIDKSVKKILFIHNASFEFQFLWSNFKLIDVMSRKKRKVMRFLFEKFNFEVRCTYMMSNCSLAQLPKVFSLDVEKKVGDLDYNKLRTPTTPLSESGEELGYCEADCLVIYKYIKRELETYERVDKIPLTSTGKVRRQLKEKVMDDWSYRRKNQKSNKYKPTYI